MYVPCFSNDIYIYIYGKKRGVNRVNKFDTSYSFLSAEPRTHIYDEYVHMCVCP
eukprot:NODE_19055_length_174_cov_0.816000_g18440_i0.p2 GENE.NODE_19055_length_174_cov_0.816000_g18440_i0~~NODE_19055_length_174_cov_0.816000_g18440_i0.p2  ORF type:complete len:54 (-),score=1.27 NODE_19055_length_174_cov_0.816000_g18440_i0:13-174(-)